MKEIPLTHGYMALVDDEDYERLAAFRWGVLARAGYTAYAIRHVGRYPVYMHRDVIGAPLGVGVDHIDGDGLNNRRANLRLANHAQNGANAKVKTRTSQFKGVYLDRRQGKWRAQIREDGGSRALGSFASEEDAARAYDRAAVRVFGVFARLNLADNTTEGGPE